MNNSQMWSMDDYEEGLCTGEQVGTPRTGAPEDEHELLAELRALGGNPESAYEIGLLLLRKDPVQFMADSPSVYNKLMDIQAQQAAKNAEAASGYWTPDKVRYLNAHKMKAIILAAVEKYIPAERIAAFRAEVELQEGETP